MIIYSYEVSGVCVCMRVSREVDLNSRLGFTNASSIRELDV